MQQSLGETAEIGSHDFDRAIRPTLERLYALLEAKYPTVQPDMVSDPTLLFAANIDACHAAAHAKWTACDIMIKLQCASMLEASRKMNWLMRFVMEIELISRDEILEIES